MDKSAKNTASTTKGNTRTQYREKNNRDNTAENENRAYNNRIDTGRIRKTIPITPFFALRDTKRHTDREIHTKEEKTSQKQKEWVNG